MRRGLDGVYIERESNKFEHSKEYSLELKVLTSIFTSMKSSFLRQPGGVRGHLSREKQRLSKGDKLSKFLQVGEEAKKHYELCKKEGRSNYFPPRVYLAPTYQAMRIRY